MFKYFSKADKALEVLFRWGTLLSVLSVGYAWLASRMASLSNLNWADLIAVGIFAALVTMLSVAAALALFRIFRPIAPAPAPLPVEDNRAAAMNEIGKAGYAMGYEWEDLKAKVSVIENGQISAADIAEIKQMITAVTNDIHAERVRIDRAEREIQSLPPLIEKIEAVRVDGAIATRDIGQLTEDFSHHRERMGSALYAIGAREHLSALAEKIRRAANVLHDRLIVGEVYDEEAWGRWEVTHTEWYTTLQNWLEIGQWYAERVKSRTLTVDDALYSIGWTIDEKQFPNAEAVRRYKKYRIVYNQWEEVEKSVEKGISAVAFRGQTEKDVRGGQPAG